jgi:SAM-dependent methyltransferase
MSDSLANVDEDPYAHIARWYDLEHDQFDDDLRFYQDMAESAGPAILEIGCGTGRVALALARAGKRVTGVDRSLAMLARARARLAAEPPTVRSRVTLVQADIITMADAVPGPFALVLIPLNTLAHCTSLSERLSLLEAIRARLVPGGRLVIDLDLQGPRRLVEAPGQLWVQGIWPVDHDPGARDGEQAVLLSHFVSGAAAPAGDVVVITHFYDAQDRDGLVRRMISSMRLALLTRGEIEITLDRAGYAVEAVYGTYELDPYEAGSARAIVVAHTHGAA